MGVCSLKVNSLGYSFTRRGSNLIGSGKKYCFKFFVRSKAVQLLLHR